MKDEKLDPENKKVLPRWLVMIVIMATAGITAAALSATGLRGPAVAWDRANKSISGVWPGDGAGPPNMQAQPGVAQPGGAPPAMAQPVAAVQAMPAQPAPVQTPIVAQPVATLSGAPVIVWGTPIGHGDRGACTNCHAVVFQQGTPLPTISALSAMPHEFRGVCNNCHQIRVSRLGGLTQVAGTPNAAGGMMGAAPNGRQPTEAEWRGLEVGPSPQGVLVNGADGIAKRAGIRVGDVITSVNAVATTTVADFVRATENGALTQGTVIVRRDGQRLAFELGPRRPPERNPPERNPPERNAPENQQPMQGTPMQGMPMQGMPMQPVQSMQGMPMQSMPMQAQAMPPQPLQAVPPQQQFQAPAGAQWGPPAAPRAPEAQF